MSNTKVSITISSEKWMKELLDLKKRLGRYVKRYYGPEVYEALMRRFNGALDIIRHSKERVLSVSVRGSGIVMIIASSKGLEEGFERVVKERSFEGYIIEKAIGVPAEEAYHIVQVGPYGLKCTCIDSLMTSIKADREFITGLRSLMRRFDIPTPIFTKYVLCKHTLAALSYGIAAGVVDRDSRVLKEILKLSVKALVLRVKGREGLSKKTLLRMYNLLLRLSKGLPIT